MSNAANAAAFAPHADGGILYAPLGTALPTDATTPLDVAFTPLGYVSVDGVTPANDEATTDTIRAWGGDVLLELTTEQSIARYDYTLVEVFNQAVNEFVFGSDNVTVTPPDATTGTTVAVEDTGVDPDDYVIVLEMFYKGKKARVVIPHGQNRITGGNAFVHTAEAGWSLQTTCIKEDGVRQYLYMENDDVSAA